MSAVPKPRQYELHPLCTFFPRLAGAEFDALRDDIAAHGLREPIVLHDGMVLDGGNRYAACLASGVEPRFRRFDGDDVVAFVLSANLHRRHLSAGQQAAIVASATDWARANRHGGDRKSDQGATLHLDSVADRAAVAGASIRTQKMADKVAREAPDLAAQVGRGEVSLPRAVEQIAPSAPRQTEVDRLKARVAELEQKLAEANEAAGDAGALAQDLQAQLDGKADDRLEQMRAELKAVRATRDIATRENAELKRMVKALRRRLGE